MTLYLVVNRKETRKEVSPDALLVHACIKLVFALSGSWVSSRDTKPLPAPCSAFCLFIYLFVFIPSWSVSGIDQGKRNRTECSQVWNWTLSQMLEMFPQFNWSSISSCLFPDAFWLCQAPAELLKLSEGQLINWELLYHKIIPSTWAWGHLSQLYLKW